MPLKKAFSSCVLALLLTAFGAGTALAEDSVGIEVAATVPMTCEVDGVSATGDGAGAEVRVVAVCNATSYLLTMDDVVNLDLIAARSGNGAGGTMSIVPGGIHIALARPGLQIVEIDLGNGVDELADLVVDIDAG